MNKELWFNELLVKIVTYEGMYYTIGKHTKEELEETKRQWNEQAVVPFNYDEVINSVVSKDLVSVLLNSNEVIGQSLASSDGLVYLPYENKLLNRKEIKESFIQYN